jgi:hypothetical protein
LKAETVVTPPTEIVTVPEPVEVTAPVVVPAEEETTPATPEVTLEPVALPTAPSTPEMTLEPEQTVPVLPATPEVTEIIETAPTEP